MRLYHGTRPETAALMHYPPKVSRKFAVSQIQVREGTPLQYRYGGKAFRLFITDSAAKSSTHTYFKDEPGLVAFADVFDQGQQLFIAYMGVNPDYRGQGLARQLVEEIYRRFDHRWIDWGEVYHENAGALWEDFKRRFPDRTYGKNRYSMKMAQHYIPDIRWAGMFTRGRETLDPRIFDGENNLHEDARIEILDVMDDYYLERGFPDYKDWTKFAILGSAVSYWWDSDADLDVTVWLDFDRFRRAHPEWADETDQEIAQEFARDMKSNLEPGVAGWRDFNPTFYVRPDRGNIPEYHPYAAYELVHGRWVVPPWKPPADWGPHSFPERIWDEFASVAEDIDEVLELPEEERQKRAREVLKGLKKGRNEAYSFFGMGILDERNVLFQYLLLSGHLRRLEEAAARSLVRAP